MPILASLAVLSGALASLFFLFTRIGGDAGHFVSHLFLNRIHLAQEWSIPFFSPFQCFGFVQAANPENPLFSIFQVLSFLIPNQFIALQVGLVICTIIFALGLSKWFHFFGLRDQTIMSLTALIVVSSGYWFSHMKVGHVSFHGIIYLPWIFWLLEKKLQSAPTKGYAWLKEVLIFTPLLFLLLNSGHVWVPIFLVLLFGRVISHLVPFHSRQLKPLFRAAWLFTVAGGFALLLSSYRIGAIFTYSLAHFPREIPVLGVFGGIRYSVIASFRALFDAEILTQGLSEKHLGEWWEWSAYLGVTSIPVILMGVYFLPRIIRFRPLWGLLIAAVLQFLLLKGTTFAELIRILPGLSGLSHFFRGSIVFVLLFGVILAVGLEGFRSRFPQKLGLVVYFIPLIILADLIQVYRQAGHLDARPSKLERVNYQWSERATNVLDSKSTRGLKGGFIEAITAGQVPSHCYSTGLLGYGNEHFHSQVKAGPILRSKGKVHNLNDVMTIFGPKGEGGVYKEKPWPLWPKSETKKLKRFLTFEQVVDRPRILEGFRWISFLAWIVYFGLIGWYVRLRYILET